MAPNSENLPEGTDAMPDNSEAAPPPHGARREPAGGGTTGKSKDKTAGKTTDLRSQAVDKARELATQGKDKAVSALDNVVKLVDEAAGTIDEKVGEQYGAYARRASETIAGFATAIREKDVDDLALDAREAVRKSPALAIGAAAAVGFLIARAVKAASAPAGGKQEGDSESASASPQAPSVPDRPVV